MSSFVSNSAAQFIVFREKRKLDWREILREKLATKNSRKIAGKMAQFWAKIDLKMTNFWQKIK